MINYKNALGGLGLLVVIITAFIIIKNRKKSKEEKDQLVEKERLERIKGEKDQQASSGYTSNELQGASVYPKKRHVIIRSEPMMNDGMVTNRWGIAKYGNKIGKILNTVRSENGDDWYEVELDKPLTGWFSDTKYGFVRADIVNVKK